MPKILVSLGGPLLMIPAIIAIPTMAAALRPITPRLPAQERDQFLSHDFSRKPSFTRSIGLSTKFFAERPPFVIDATLIARREGFSTPAATGHMPFPDGFRSIQPLFCFRYLRLTLVLP